MRRKKTPELVLKRMSLPMHLPRSEGDNVDRELFPWMLAEDVRLSLVPFSVSRRSGSPQIRLTPDDPEVRELLGLAFETSAVGDLDYALCEWIRSCGEEVVAKGLAGYEIAYMHHVGDEKPVAFRLIPIPSETLGRDGGDVYQLVPAGAVLESGSLQEARHVVSEAFHHALPLDSLLVVEWPANAQVNPRAIIEELARLTIAEHEALAMITPQPSVPIDFDQFKGTHLSAIAECTRGVGWNARGQFGEIQTSFHYTLRYLHFERFKIQLRSMILEKLNAALGVAGKRVGIEARVDIDGLPNEGDIRTGLEDLNTGKRSFKDLLERFRP